MTTEVLILTPEKTVVSYRIASLPSRIGAHLIDLILVIIMYVSITVVAGVIQAYGQSKDNQFLMSIGGLGPAVALLVSFLYFILFEAIWNGQTPGKRSTKLRVRMADGTPISGVAAIGRNLLRVADIMPGFYFVGCACMLTTPRSQRFGDLVANTIVTHEKRPEAKFMPAPHRLAGEHPYETYVGDLRGMTLDEYNVLRRLCDRFPYLPAATQTRMLVEIWRPIATRRGVPNLPDVHPLYLAEATVMKYGRQHGML